MKKLLTIVLPIVLILCLSGCIFEEISLFYDDFGEMDGFCIAVNETANCCFVGGYTCTEYAENMEITIPDKYDNKPITRIGGYMGRGVPTPFGISVSELYMNAPEDSEYHSVFCGDIAGFDITEDYRVQELPFIVNIGKNIKSIENVNMVKYYPHINEDGSITFYHPVVSIKCSDENKYFYSENGKLYNKKTKELITEFEYAKQ